MKAILTNGTIDILGGQKNMDATLEATSHYGVSNTETQSKGVKGKIKKVWIGILNVAEDIKEKIIPIVESVCKAIARIIMAVAIFCNSQQRYALGRVV